VIKVSTERIEREFRQGGEGIVLLLVDPKGIVFAANRREWLYRSLQSLTQEDAEEVARSQQFGPGPWEWSGLTILGAGRAQDKSGREYRFYRLDVSAYPGWSVVYLDDLQSVSRKISGPLFRVTAPIILVLCFLIGLSVLFLYRRASGDIAKRKAAEEALREAQEKLTRHSGELERQVKERTRRFTSILRHTPAVVYVKDREGRYAYVNPRFTELFGVRNAQVHGKTDFDVFPYEFAHALRENDRKVLSGRTPILMEETFPRGDDPHVYLSTRFPIYDAAGDATALCGISIDISGIKRAEDQLRRLSDSIIAGQEKERAAVARELHDEFGQVLTALGLDAAWLRDRLKGADPEASRQAQAMCGIIDRAIDEVRGIATRLRPGALDNLGLVDALDWYIRDFEKRSRIRCVYRPQGAPGFPTRRRPPPTGSPRRR
jgi:PAS domain S-box-containing protein